MEEIVFKVDIPSEFREKFEQELSRIVSALVKEIEFSIAKDIVSKSKFTEKDAKELASKVELSMHKDLKSKGLI